MYNPKAGETLKTKIKKSEKLPHRSQGEGRVHYAFFFSASTGFGTEQINPRNPLANAFGFSSFLEAPGVKQLSFLGC